MATDCGSPTAKRSKVVVQEPVNSAEKVRDLIVQQSEGFKGIQMQFCELEYFMMVARAYADVVIDCLLSTPEWCSFIQFICNDGVLCTCNGADAVYEVCM